MAVGLRHIHRVDGAVVGRAVNSVGKGRFLERKVMFHGGWAIRAAAS